MKLVYCICNICNPGGMERVMLNKINYLVEKLHWDITVVTTDQKHRPPFYTFPKEVKFIDLGINYTDDNHKSPIGKIWGYLQKRKLHKKKLSQVLIQENADIVSSLFPSESSFIPDLNDGSKKVLELHFCKHFRLQYGRKGLLGIIDRWRTIQDEKLVRKFDGFIVLTDKDKRYWGDIPNILTIPNAVKNNHLEYSSLDNKRVIAVGRLDYQKGFDRLVEAWKIVQQHGGYQDWKLEIFGQGEWYDKLQQMIVDYGLKDTVCINTPSNQINEEYKQSSLIVMSSNYEGFGMVLVEAMSCGVPAVAFDCECGPSDIIQHEQNGLLVKNGDIPGLAEAMMKVMGDEALRKRMSEEAKKVTDTYSEEKVMKQWVELFEGLVMK